MPPYIVGLVVSISSFDPGLCRRGAFAQSRVRARTRHAVASTQFTIVSISFTSFRCFQQVHHIVFFTTFVSSPTATAQLRIVHIMFFSPVSSVLSSRLPLSRPVRIPVQSCTISRVTSVPISTIVEIIFSSFQGLRSVSRFRETRQSLPVALHHFRHQRHSGQAQRNPSQHFSFPFVWFWGFHSLRVMFFLVFRTGFRKNPIFLIPAFRRWRALRGASAHNPRGQTPQNRYNPNHLVRSFRFLSSNKSIQFPLFPDRIPKNPIF